MTYESKVALERIVTILEKSGDLSQRQVRIFEIALEGLGMVSRQRSEIVAKWKQPILDRIAVRRARQVARIEAEAVDVA